ncbi:hypothetical protein [Aeromonas salmonicida]|uniref:Uncharacterized protein n=1 Tax=Aeromonas salmonicida TaxID=645 RepID=A0AAX1PK71_AERSA|nr:hypothetical protein [Aeromonas salmonicida]RAJ06383.1 hypothetical protein DEU50_104164 [Aeromonas salmonicida]
MKVLILSALLLSASLTAAPLTIAERDQGNRVIIEQAYAELVKVCPTVRDGWGVDKVEASYNHGEMEPGDYFTGWRFEQYGWKEEVSFSVNDKHTETHHFYVATGNKKGVIIDGKQASLDFCGIKGNMSGHYLVK